jgi:hypothetical protein
VPPQPVPLVRVVLVVEAQEALEAAGQGGAAGEVAAPKLHPPVLLQDRALQALHETIGPGVPRPGAGVANPQALAVTIVVGALVVLISLFADQMGLGWSPGVGWRQILGVVVGALVILAGGYLWWRQGLREKVSP